MKRHLSPARGYRQACTPREGETGFQVVLEQSDLYLVARQDLSKEALQSLRVLRGQLKAYIALHPEFASSLSPVEVDPTAPRLVRDMAEAARVCGVGPMAAVAGAIAEALARELVGQSPDLLVENGGDLYLCSTRPRKVGLLPDPEAEAVIGVVLPTEAFPVALCSSSASIGHSLSLGRGDLVVVRSADACLADAAATALCNRLKQRRDLRRVLDQAKAWSRHGVQGVLAQCEDQLAAWGDLELTVL